MKANLFRLAALVAMGIALVACDLDGDSDDPPTPSASPTVTATWPVDLATDVSFNVKITAIFDMKMKESSISVDNFYVQDSDETAVPGTTALSPDGLSAIFTPTANLTANTEYTATLSTNTESLAGSKLKANYVWSFTTGATPDTTAPTVLSTIPAHDAVAVASSANITAVFSEAMDPATISGTTITLKQGDTAIAGTVTSPLPTTVKFDPASALAYNTVYTATISTLVMDVAGNALAVAKTWSFTTGATPDTTAPTVLSTIPVNEAEAVATSANITAVFSEEMDPTTITGTTITLKQGSTPIAGTVTTPLPTTVTFDPTSALAYNTVYTATISALVKDSSGNALAVQKTWSFTTAEEPPTVLSTVPAHEAIAIALDANITVAFSKAMDPSTINNTSITLKQGTAPVAGTVTTPLTTTARLDPTALLEADTVYTATISTQVTDIAGNALAVEKTWTFRTRTLSAEGPDPIDLGLAGTYVILAESGISTVPTSEVTGDLGISPAPATAITGFELILPVDGIAATSSQVTGSVYASNYAVPTPTNLTTAITDRQLAYDTAAELLLPDSTDLHAGNLSGQTLTPGLYKWNTDVLINDDLTLDGSDNDVWIFQISGNITMAANKKVIMSGSALPKNVFWQVAGGTGVSINAGSEFVGIVLTATQINLGTGASVVGRLLSHTAVNIQSSTVTEPAP